MGGGLVKQIQDQGKWKAKLAVYEKSPVVYAVGALVKNFNKRSWSEIILILISIRYVLPAHADQLRTAVSEMIQRLLKRVGAPVPPVIFKGIVRLIAGVGKFCFGLAKTIASGGAAITGDRGIGEDETSNLVASISNDSCKGYVSGKVIAAASLLPRGAALGDNGATIDCSKSGIGRLSGTFNRSDAGSLSVGDAAASLASRGTHLHAIRRYGMNGEYDERIYRMHDTPNGIADIFSEALEVTERSSTVIQRPGEPRKYITESERTLRLLTWQWLRMVLVGCALNLSRILIGSWYF